MSEREGLDVMRCWPFSVDHDCVAHDRFGFGEATLERLLADFLPVGSFELQYAITPGSLERVDAVVKFSRLVLPIDSNAPWSTGPSA